LQLLLSQQSNFGYTVVTAQKLAKNLLTTNVDGYFKMNHIVRFPPFRGKILPRLF